MTLTDDQYQGLPVFGYLEPEEQVAQLTELLSKWQVTGLETTGNCDSDVALVVSKCDVVASKAGSDAEVEMILNSLVSLIVPLPAQASQSVVTSFCDVVCADEFLSDVGKIGAVTRVLTNLLHGFHVKDSNQRAVQFHIFMALLKVAAKTGQITQVPTDLTKINEWFVDWKVSVEKQREALRLLHQALLNNKNDANAAAKVMVALLSTYTAGDANKATQDAVECVRSAIADPQCLLFDHLLQLLPVTSLEKFHPRMFQLLDIFVSGTLQDFLKFHAANGKFITEELKLDMESVVHKMRILTLMSIGEKDREVSFDQLSTQLKLDHGEALEDFIIQATQSKAVKAKMDQLHGAVIMTSVTHRQFRKVQWEILRNKLDSWSANLKHAKLHLDSVKHVEAHG